METDVDKCRRNRQIGKEGVERRAEHPAGGPTGRRVNTTGKVEANQKTTGISYTSPRNGFN